ncbi:hypothetical protein Tco_1313295 [Tanacetum coccineum]
MPLFPSPEPMVSYFDDLDYFKDFEKEFPAIVYNDALTSKSDFLTETTLSPQHIDEFDLNDEASLSECDEGEQNILDFNDLFPFNVVYPNELKTDTDNDNDKVDIEHSSRIYLKPLPDLINTNDGAYAHGSNKLLETINMPLLPSPEPMVSYFDDLDYFKDFEKEFPAIVYNDALTSKSDFLTETTLSPQHIDEFDLKDETSLSECDEGEQNILDFNDLFPFNVVYPNELKTDTDNDNDKVDIEHSSRIYLKPLPDLINTNDGAYAHGSNKLLETSHDISNKIF